MRVRLAPCLTVFLAAAVALSIAAAPAGAAPQPFYIGIVIVPDKDPAAYVSIQNNQIRAAETLEDLEAAKPTKAKNARIEDMGGRSYQQFYDFPEVELPVSTPGVTKLVAKLSFYRSRSLQRSAAASRDNTGIFGEVSLSRKDESGSTWTYVYHPNTYDRSQSKNSPERPLLLKVSGADPGSLKFEITTKMEGRKARIGMQAKADGVDIYNVQKNGKNAPAKLEVRNKDGKTIVSEAGDPVKFGFT